MKFLRVLIFVIFPAICKNKFPQKLITAKIFPTTFYSRVNILWLKFATQKYCTKKLSLFNSNLSLLLGNEMIKMTSKTVTGFTQATHTMVLFKNMYFHCMYSIKTKIYQ